MSGQKPKWMAKVYSMLLKWYLFHSKYIHVFTSTDDYNNPFFLLWHPGFENVDNDVKDANFVCIKKVLAVQDLSEMLNLNWGSINFWVFELFTTWFDELRIPNTIFLKKSDCFHEKNPTNNWKFCENSEGIWNS